MVPTEQITKERFERWAKRLSESHATPALLVGIGHDQVKGQVVICTLEDFSNDEIRAFLVFALKELE